MLSVFFTLCFSCLVPCLLPFFFAVLLFLGSLFEEFFGSELLFLGVGVGLVFFGGLLPMFLLYYFWRFAPEIVWKNSLDVRCSLFLCCFRRRHFFKRHRSGSNRTPHARTCFVCFFLFLCPAAPLFRLFWPCVLLLGVFLGAFLGFSWYLL